MTQVAALPPVTIVVTSYNYAHLLDQALQSACRQTYLNLEILVLDNASTDETPAILARYAGDPRVRIIRHAENIGAVANHNAGIAAARGEFLVFLSADDLMLPGRIERHVAFALAHPEYDLSHTAFSVMNGTGHIVNRLSPVGEPPCEYTGSRNDFAALLAYGNYVSFPTLLLPRRLFAQCGPFDTRIKAVDYDFLLRATRAGIRIGYFPENLHVVRIHDAQASGTAGYIATGDDVRELCTFAATYRDDPALSGYEHRIIHNLRYRYDRCRQAGFADQDGAAKRRLDELAATLSAAAGRRAAAKFVPDLTFLVDGDGPLLLVLETLRTLVAQADPQWRALVVQSPGVSLDALCRHLDPLGRIDVLTLKGPLPRGAMYNAAILAAAGNCFAWIEPGIAVDSGHAGIIKAHFAAGTARALQFACEFTVIGRDGQYRHVPEVFAHDLSTADLLIAPGTRLSAFAVRIDVVDRIAAFRADLDVYADWDFMLRVAACEKPVFVPRTIVQHDLGIEPLPGVAPAALYAGACEIFRRHPSRALPDRRRRERFLEGLASLPQSGADEAEPALGGRWRSRHGSALIAERRRGPALKFSPFDADSSLVP